jgi:hypothetical protein
VRWRSRKESSLHGAAPPGRCNGVAVRLRDHRVVFIPDCLSRDRTLAQGAARSSDLDFTRAESRKLLEVARSPASALPARPSVLHRCASSRRCRDCSRTRSRRSGGRRTPGGAHNLVGRRDHPGCRRPRSRRSCSSSHLGRSAQASFLNAGECQQFPRLEAEPVGRRLCGDGRSN